MESKIVYFEHAGKGNTDETLRLAFERAQQLGIKKAVIATTGGDNALKAVDAMPGMQVIAVSHSTGFTKPNVNTFPDDMRKEFEEKGGIVFTGTHLLAGLSRAMRMDFQTHTIGDLVANVLRMFGQGMKVCAEIAVMAADAGLVSTEEDIVVIAGTGRGADTAVVLAPVHSASFFSLKIKEIICKPHF